MRLLNSTESTTATWNSANGQLLQEHARGYWPSPLKLAAEMPLRFSLIAVFVLLALAFAVFQPGYEDFDDVYFSMIASGKGISSTPDEHLIFSNVLIGQALKWLYTASPSIPWYGSYLLVLHWLAQTAILYVGLTIPRRGDDSQPGVVPGSTDRANRRRDVTKRIALYLLYFALVEIPLLNHFQYTSTAFIAAQGGIFLLLLAAQRQAIKTNARIARPLFAAAGLLLVAGLVRPESLIMAVLVAAPAALLFIKDLPRKALLHCAGVIAAVSVLLMAAGMYDFWYYNHDPVWRDYRSLNQLRGNFNDRDGRTFYSAETASVFSSVGWSANDHALSVRWFYDDPETFNTTKLTTIIQSYPWEATRQSFALWRDAAEKFGRNRSMISVMLALCFIWLVGMGGALAKKAIVASALMAILLIALVTCLKKIPPERVYFPLWSFPLSVGLLLFPWRNSTAVAQPERCKSFAFTNIFWRAWLSWRKMPTMHQVAIVMLIVAVVMGGYRQISLSQKVRRGRSELQQLLANVQPGGDKVYIAWGASPPLAFFSPLDNLDALSGVPLLALCWPQKAPWYETIKQQHNISNLVQALYERDDIQVIAMSSNRSLMMTFMKEHYGADVEFVLDRHFGKDFDMGRFRLRRPHNTANAQPGNVRR